MSRLSPMEEKILVNLSNSTPKVVATKLGISVKTVYTYLSRVRRKRKEARKLIAQTNRYKRLLYPKRRGE